MAAACRVDAQRWSQLFGELLDTIGARFARPEPRGRVRDFVAGLLAPLPAKNCWTIAEHAGDAGPGGMQNLIGRASWDDTLVRADVRDFVASRLGHPEGVLLIDETGDLTKGIHTVGVQRQYSGTAGKIENCQLAVHPSYASPFGHTLVDVALYLPKSWTDDPSRRLEAGVPDTVTFATKPQLARRLIEAAVTGGLPCRWVAGDEAWLLIRRSRTSGELAFYRCWSPELVALHQLVTVAGRRWSIEEAFQATKTGLGLDQHQHRRWKAWHRWTTLVIAAHALLAAATAACTTTSVDG